MARGIKMHERSAYWIQSIDAHRCASPSEWLCGFDELANWTLFEWIRLLGMWVAQLTNLTNLMIRQTYLFIHWNWLFFDHSNYRISCQSINAFEFESKWGKKNKSTWLHMLCLIPNSHHILNVCGILWYSIVNTMEFVSLMQMNAYIEWVSNICITISNPFESLL